MLLWKAEAEGITLPEFIQDQLGLWVGHATDEEIERAMDEAKNDTDGAVHSLGVLRSWRKKYCPNFDGREDREAFFRKARRTKSQTRP